MDQTLLPSDRAATSRWHGLDPLTRLVVALGTVVAALLLGSVPALALLAVAAVLVPAAIAGELGAVLRLALVLSLPLAFSAVVVNLLFAPGSLADGAMLAATVVARVITMAGATVLFYRTSRPGELVASLQGHGLSARATYVVHNAVVMIPRLAQQAGEVAEAQRARGLDTEGSLLRRGRGLVALAVPTVLGALEEVETRTLALETRGFGRPARPTALRELPDGPGQRLARWGVVVGVAALALGRVTGTLP